MNHPCEAVADLEHSLLISPGYDSVHYYLAAAYRQLNNQSKARASLDILEKSEVEDDEVPMLKGKIPEERAKLEKIPKTATIRSCL